MIYVLGLAIVLLCVGAAYVILMGRALRKRETVEEGRSFGEMVEILESLRTEMQYREEYP